MVFEERPSLLRADAFKSCKNFKLYIRFLKGVTSVAVVTAAV